MVVKIALDVMGGDNSPHALIEGAIAAIEEKSDMRIYLVGDEKEIKKVLENRNYPLDNLEIIHTEEVIHDDDQPTKAIRKKSEASLPLSMKYVKENKVDAVVSAGNTGAFMAGGLMILGRLQGISRPALAPIIPSFNGNSTVILDVGANMDAKSRNLADFAMMGSLYAEKVLGREEPSVGLINVGEEAGKGNKLLKETYEILEKSHLNFKGNLESRDLLDCPYDIVVCDGFLGNILLKFAEGMGSSILMKMKEEFTSGLRNKMGAYLLQPAFKNLKKELDYTEYGGAPFLGVNGLCIKCHGSSNSKAVKNALVMQAYPFIKENVISLFLEEIEKGWSFQNAE
ncbi:phosphate acyltransferase PlsX [Natranaerofaba carboxydovora]|uniref:phosphate acyltransferase PlsX n=1 Tax=Natranaerofaba carboxydovora TaxID=2742683 RepID=UPI001F13D59D|nr:phosphate acyltransferase PlsX [Natranaerofaba carboxydovora]UMZ73321.1 Phosphate acyltransferase [Natranaerofaba carboxydovora]